MRKDVFVICAILFSLSLSAQNKMQSISAELFGAQNSFGVNYDARFKGNSGLGYRVGIGYGYGETNTFFGEETVKGVGVPVELNYLLGKKNNKFEVGVGTSLGVYHVNETHTYYYAPTPEYPDGLIEEYKVNGNRFGYFVFGTIGYRYQRPNGFVFRVGISPSVNFGDKYGLNKSLLYPYVGFGWSF